VASPGRVLRTVRHLRPVQVWAQAQHVLRGAPRPVRLEGPAPRLRVQRVPAPFLPAPLHARWDGGRRVELIGRPVAFADAIDWDFAGEGPLWAYHLHQFDFARRPGVPPARRAALLADWVARHPKGTGWDPHPISLRTLSWGKLLLTPGALDASPGERERILRSLASQIETLSRHPERRLQANHLFSNLLAVVWGALLLEAPAAVRWRERASAAFGRELDLQIGADGLHEERSPMYHALLLENVLDLLNLARAVADTPGEVAGEAAAWAERLAPVAGRMLGALEVMTQPDGDIALFADSAFDVAHPPALLADYAKALGVAARAPSRPGVLDAGGYVRLEARPFGLLASVAGPSPAHQPGHAHNDALAFELWVEGERVVTDAGVPEYIPGPLRDACRSVRAHATAEIGGREPAELWGAHRVGGRPEVALAAVEPGQRAEATCRGWATRDTLHRRVFEVSPDGVTVSDRIEGRSRPWRVRLPLAPGLEPRLRGSAARVELGDGSRLALDLDTRLAWRLERAPAFPRFGAREDRACLVGEAAAGVREAVVRMAREGPGDARPRGGRRPRRRPAPQKSV